MSEQTLHQRAATPARASLQDRVALRLMRAAARRIRLGRLVVTLPDGQRHEFGDPATGPTGELGVRDLAAARRILLGGDLAAGESYMDGQWSSPDLPAVAKLAAINRDGLGLTKGWWRIPAKLAKTIAHRARRNTVSQARRNIAASSIGEVRIPSARCSR